MKNTTTFRLKGKKKKGEWLLPRGMAKAPDGFMKRISYRPGTTSIFDDDNKKSAAKPRSVVFSYNMKKHDPAVEIEVPKNDKLLYEYLTKHPKFNKEYYIYDENAEATKKAKHYDNVEAALNHVSEGGDDEVRAAALTVFGPEYFTKSVEVCRAKLKETAFNSPDKILAVYKATDFQNRYLVALMYCNSIIENNETHTAVLWSDTKNPILTVVTGEKGIDKVTEYINRGTDESIALMQEFQARIDKVAKAKKTANLDSEKAAKLINSQESEIEKLKRELAEEKAKNAAPQVPAADKYADLTIEEATTLYNEQNPKTPVPTSKEGNLEWIKSKLK